MIQITPEMRVLVAVEQSMAAKANLDLAADRVLNVCEFPFLFSLPELEDRKCTSQLLVSRAVKPGVLHLYGVA